MKLRNVIPLILGLSTLAIGGVSAAFTYNIIKCEETIIIDNLNGTIAEFEFANVPDGDAYAAFVNAAVTDINKGNAGDLVFNLNKRLDKGGDFTYYGSMAVTGGYTSLESLLGAVEGDIDVSNLSFIIEAVDRDDKPTNDDNFLNNGGYYNLYLTNVHLGERGTVNWWGTAKDPGQPVAPVDATQDRVYYHNYIYPIYKVEIKPDGENSNSYNYGDIRLGAARSMWYLENIGNNRTHIPAFDTQSWIEASNDTITEAATYPNGTLNDDSTINFGSNKDNSIWVYAPIPTEDDPNNATRTTILNMASSDGAIYYKTLFVVGPDNKKKYDVSVSLVTPEDSNTTQKSIEIFRASGDSLRPSPYVNDECKSITFEVEAATAVYYKIKADGPVELVLSKSKAYS